VFVTRAALGACVEGSPFVLIANATTPAFAIHPVLAPSGSPQACTVGVGNSAVNGNLNLGDVVQPWAPAVAIDPNTTPFLYAARVVRYRIGPSTDPTDLNPALWRSSTGGYAGDGTAVAEPGEVSFPDPGSPWELIARGIEDLQIEYRAGDGVWRNRPLPTAVDDWVSLVREVRITLSARASAANLQGQTMAEGAGEDAVRGQLTTVVAPRAAINELRIGGQIQ
jgi:hypothetical protein